MLLYINKFFLATWWTINKMLCLLTKSRWNVNLKNIFDQTPTAILLRISSSDQDLKSFQLDSNEVTVGRAKENSVVIADVLISRKHAVFRQDKGQWTVESVGMNGVAVNNIIVGLPLDHNRLENGPIDWLIILKILIDYASID